MIENDHLDYIRAIAPQIYKYGSPSFGYVGPYIFKFVGGELKVTLNNKPVSLFEDQMTIFDFLD